jgi:hypothetical protein
VWLKKKEGQRMKCEGCRYFEENCIRKSCAYRRISYIEIQRLGIKVINNFLTYNGTNYKVIDFISLTREFVCVEIEEKKVG